MKFQTDLSITKLPRPLRYTDKILLIGSCFTEHIADRLVKHQFQVCSNPHGILFNPLSVAESINSYLEHKEYKHEDLFYLNELWNSWQHHTRFSDIDPSVALSQINSAQAAASGMILEADYVIITLGSAFQYYLKENKVPVANNHRAPGQWFEKRLLPVDVIIHSLEEVLKHLHLKNPRAQVLFTISPVRHLRDGLIENNRSKARLIEAVHELCHTFSFAHYFPAYELVIDVLRDYRFYDIDLAHPNYAATSYVWDAFTASCMDTDTVALMKEVSVLNTARQHRPRFPQTQAHKEFCDKYALKAKELQQQHPFLDLSESIQYFEMPFKE